MWNELTKDPYLWKEVNVIFHSRKSQNTLTRSFVKKLLPCVARLRLDFRHFLLLTEQLNCEEFFAELQRCPHLKMLTLKGAALSDRLSSVIDLCSLFLQDLKILKFNHSKFTDRPPRGKFRGTSKIEVLDISSSFLGNYSRSPFSKMPHLEQLCLYNTNVDSFWFEGDISFLNQLHVLDVGYTRITPGTFSVIRDNGLNLKELYYCNLYVLDHELNFNNSLLSHLKTICLRGVSTVTCEGIVSLIMSCQSLQNVYVNQEVAALYAVHPFFVANKCKLEIVKFIHECKEHRKVTY